MVEYPSAGIENSRVGMGLIRRTLETLYSKEVVDIDASTDLVGGLPLIMGRVLGSPEAASCPFSTYTDSLRHFARSIYSLRLEGEHCTTADVPAGCDFYNPENIYGTPSVTELTYSVNEISFSSGI